MIDLSFGNFIKLFAHIIHCITIKRSETYLVQETKSAVSKSKGFSDSEFVPAERFRRLSFLLHGLMYLLWICMFGMGNERPKGIIAGGT